VKLYNKLLVWDIMKKPAITRVTEQLLNPVLGKSLVVYATKPMARGGSWSLAADDHAAADHAAADQVEDEPIDIATASDHAISERESVDASA